ncbi:MAG: lipid-A-disaccharide synthase [bacterium]|nr:lipid-A-disaccharide synthase [bacterium]
MSNKILIVTGEASGDLHGGLLTQELKKLDPDLEIYAVGSKKMEASGAKIIFESTQLAIFGFTEIFSRLGLIRKAFDEIKKFIYKEKPSLVVLIDYPGFNIRLARFINEQRIPVIYYISPQIWAWNKGRINVLKKLVTKMIVVFPFEEDIYKNAGVNVEFVGHPLLDLVKSKLSKEETMKKFGFNANNPIIGLLPGSRSDEIDKLLPIMVDVCTKVKKNIPESQFFICWANNLNIKIIEDKLKKLDFPISIISGWNYELISISTLVMVASGTATLETAILETPMVILGKVSFFTSILARILIKIPYLGLPNVLAQKMIVPELLQGNAKTKKIFPVVSEIIRDENTRKEMKNNLIEIRGKLGVSGAANRAALSILKELKNNV